MAKRSGCLRFILFLVVLGIGIAVAIYFFGKKYILADNIQGDEDIELFIPTGTSLDDLHQLLIDQDVLIDEKGFTQLAKVREFTEVRPGRYIINGNWNNLELVNALRAGSQSAVRLVINNIRTREELAGKIAGQLEFDSLAMLDALNDPILAQTYDFTQESFPAMFLANTYEVYWNTSVEDFCERMNKEYHRFWNEERMQKAANIGLTPDEVIILASIVEEETKKKSELSTVAGLYLNRINRGMKLEADPTVKYAVGDFGLRRVLNRHLEFDSPYNTYLHVGLPPGPIRIPELNVVEATLNPREHDYLFMCASPDLDGTHAFAKTLAQHNVNANKYRQKLNQLGVYR